MSAKLNQYYFYTFIFLLLFSKMTSTRVPAPENCPGVSCKNPIGSNLKQIQRLQRIKQQILFALGFQGDNSSRNRTTEKENRESQHSPVNRSDISNGGPEIITFSESIGKKDRRKKLLQFVIKVEGSHLEVISAHLWVLVKKRRPRKQSKTIVLKVYKVEKKKKSELTYLRTRVKETRWQKLTLPISLVQEAVKPPVGRLKLKIECRRCGRAVKLIIPKGSKKNRTRVVPPTRTLRLRKFKRRPRPFLVINTRKRAR